MGYGLHRAVISTRDPDTTVASTRRGASEEDEAGRRACDERLADLRAWQEILPPSACFTHVTAAAVYGLWLPPLPERLPEFLCLPKGEERPRRKGLSVSRLTIPFTPVVLEGVRLAPLPEVLLACGRDLGLLDLAVLLDSALRSGGNAPEHFEAVAGPRRRGAPALREALSYADPRAESPWETVLRVFHVLCEVPVEPQFEVYDEDARFVARGDLRITGTRVLHEYDGAVHRDRRTHVADLSRDRRLVNAGWVRRGYTSGDLLYRSHVILREADAALGRPHDPRRLDRWLDALRGSLFSSSGRARLLKRLGIS